MSWKFSTGNVWEKFSGGKIWERKDRATEMSMEMFCSNLQEKRLWGCPDTTA